MNKKLYKSGSNKMIAGVCGGIAEYFNIDSAIVHIVWALLALLFGSGILVYLICAVVIPKDANA